MRRRTHSRKRVRAGVKCYELDVHPVSAGMKLSAAPGGLEMFFCSAGELTLRPLGPNKTTRQGLVVSSRQVLLLGGGDWDLGLRSKRLQGVLVLLRAGGWAGALRPFRGWLC